MKSRLGWEARPSEERGPGSRGRVPRVYEEGEMPNDGAKLSPGLAGSGD